MARRLKICIVDDAMAACRELQGMLETAGHEVTCTSAGRVHLAVLSASAPDLLLIGVPDDNSPGMALYRRLQNHRQLRQVPVIVVSDDPDLEYELLDAFDFQTRPCDRDRLLANLKRLVAGNEPAVSLEVSDSEQLGPFRNYLLEHSALHFNRNNRRILERALLRRTRAMRLASLADYYRFLTADSENFDELNKLLGLLTIGETSFFRYRSHRQALRQYVIPRLIDKNRDAAQLRIWSAGCSTGEESYSLAILLLEYFPELVGWDIHILATDINKRSLRKAREGVYGERTLRMMEQSLKDRYFRKVDNQYLVARQVRNMVHFDSLNLQTDPFPQNIDLLFCRNVLIYFEMDTIRRIVASFCDALRPGGYLFMGHAETLQNVSEAFQRHHQHDAFFYQLKIAAGNEPSLRTGGIVSEDVSDSRPKRSPVKSTQPVNAPLRPAQRAPSSAKQTPPIDAETLYRQAMTAFEHERFNQANQLFDRLLDVHPGHAQAMVGKGLLLANQGMYAEARIYCARAIREDDLMPEAYMLRGLILDMEGLLDRALVEYQKVLWLDPGYVMAHYLSAKVYGRLADPVKRNRSLRNTAKALEQADAQNAIPFSGGLTRAVFLEIVRRELAEPPAG